MVTFLVQYTVQVHKLYFELYTEKCFYQKTSACKKKKRIQSAIQRKKERRKSPGTVPLVFFLLSDTPQNSNPNKALDEKRGRGKETAAFIYIVLLLLLPNETSPSIKHLSPVNNIHYICTKICLK